MSKYQQENVHSIELDNSVETPEPRLEFPGKKAEQEFKYKNQVIWCFVIVFFVSTFYFVGAIYENSQEIKDLQDMVERRNSKIDMLRDELDGHVALSTSNTHSFEIEEEKPVEQEMPTEEELDKARAEAEKLTQRKAPTPQEEVKQAINKMVQKKEEKVQEKVEKMVKEEEEKKEAAPSEDPLTDDMKDVEAKLLNLFFNEPLKNDNLKGRKNGSTWNKNLDRWDQLKNGVGTFALGKQLEHFEVYYLSY